MTNRTQDTRAAVEAFVDAMMQASGQISLIVAHMQRYPSADDAGSIPDVLRGLLTEVLAGLPRRFGAADVATAAQILSLATDAVGDEVYTVPPEFDDLCGEVFMGPPDRPDPPF